MDRGSWWVIVHRVAKSRTQFSVNESRAAQEQWRKGHGVSWKFIRGPQLSKTQGITHFFFFLGKNWIYLERNTLHRQSVGHLRRREQPRTKLLTMAFKALSALPCPASSQLLADPRGKPCLLLPCLCKGCLPSHLLCPHAYTALCVRVCPAGLSSWDSTGHLLF